jgi:membrane glycosyltransferase
LFLMALVPTLWASWSVMSDRPPLLRGATLGFASMFAALSSLLWALTLVTALTDFAAWWVAPALVCIALAVPFAILLWLARAGRKAEQQRDFASKP